MCFKNSVTKYIHERSSRHQCHPNSKLFILFKILNSVNYLTNLFTISITVQLKCICSVFDRVNRQKRQPVPPSGQRLNYQPVVDTNSARLQRLSLLQIYYQSLIFQYCCSSNTCYQLKVLPLDGLGCLIIVDPHYKIR